MDNTFITDGMRFSFSNIGTFKTCPYAWFLTYIEAKPRKGNWYSEFGNFCHDIMEKYISQELDIFSLSTYFEDNYPLVVMSPEPPFPAGIAQRYCQEMVEFLDNLDFDRDNNEVLSLEEFISMKICDVKVVAKPDLVYVNKETGKKILLDYKTSKPFKQNGKIDEKKIKEYSKQLLLYAYILREVSKIKIDELQLWFLRYNELVTIPFTDEDIQNTINEFIDGVNEIKGSKEYPANIKNEFFCQMLCSVSDDCKFKKVYVPKNEPEFIPE